MVLYRKIATADLWAAINADSRYHLPPTSLLSRERMGGLVKEALKHGVQESPQDEELKIIAIIAQYQRMCHYGLAGFGSAASYAKALGIKDAATKLGEIVSSIYQADEYSIQLSDRTAKHAAKHSAK